MISQSLDMLQLYVDNMKAAFLKGDHEVVKESLQWWFEHSPKAEDGTSVIDISIDKAPTQVAPSGPTINIGFKLGGMVGGEQRALPQGKIIDIEKDKE